MPGGEDPDNRHDFPGGFAGDAHSAFTKAGRTATEEEVFSWTSGLLALRAAHPALQTGIEQNLFADADVFAFVRATDAAGCTPDHSTERLLIVVNKAAQSKPAELPLEDTALAGCTEFHATAVATGSAPLVSGGNLHVEEPAESMTVYEVR
jgi:glycosidase